MKIRFLFFLLLCAPFARTQTIDTYSVHLKHKAIPGLMGLQSYAFAQHNGKWLIIGGRLDGLHRRQPFAAFDSIGHNNQLLVIDPVSGQLWKAAVDQLLPKLRNQLKSTNSCFVQDGNTMLFAGGYGIEQAADDHRTFPYLTTFNVPEVMRAVQQNQLHDSLFTQIEDSLFAVTGGQLLQLDEVFYLVGGHRFDGRYNPADRPTFTQTYTNSVRRFRLDAAGKPEWLPAFTSEQLMHRRDFNVTLQQTPAGDPYLTAFSGVFQKGVDLPFMTAVHIDPSGMVEQPGFRQYYQHYHCPEVLLFEPKTGTMHTFFFGGIAQYEDSAGVLLQDNEVPFVRTISRVTRYPDGSMKEFLLPVKMPFLLGAGGEFIQNPNLPKTANGIPEFRAGTDSVYLGTILGGIASTDRNIFWINDDAESAAFSGMFEVYLVKSTVPQTYNKASNSTVYLHAIRNEEKERYQVAFTLGAPSMVTIAWKNSKGKTIHRKTFQAASGAQTYPKLLPKKPGLCDIWLTIDDQPVERLYFLIPEE